MYKILNVLSIPRKKQIFFFKWLQLYSTQVIRKPIPRCKHLKISTFIKNENKRGNLIVLSFGCKQDLILRTLQKKHTRLVFARHKTHWYKTLLKTWDVNPRGGKRFWSVPQCNGGGWDQQVRAWTHWALLWESLFILANTLFHQHSMGKQNCTSSDQPHRKPIDCIIVQKWEKNRVLI